MAVSIGKLRYDIVADTSQFTKGIVATRSELSLAKKMFEQTRTPVEAYSMALTKLDNLHAKGKIETELYHRAVSKLHSDYQQLARSATQAAAAEQRLNREIANYARTTESANRMTEKRMQFMAGRLPGGGGIAGAASMAGLSAAGAGFAGMSFSRDVIRDFMDLEAAIADFGVLAGDKGIGKALIDDFRILAKETPLILSSINNAARTLLSFGVESSKVGDSLRRLGDISGGNAERFERLALVYGQVTAAQRLQGQDLLQFVNAGWNPLLEITKRSGESMMEVRKRMEDGKVSINEVEQALIAATSAGGRFENRMSEMAKTTSGKLDILKGDFSQFRTLVGETFAPLIGAGLAIGGVGVKGLQMRQNALEGIRSRISGGIMSALGIDQPKQNEGTGQKDTVDSIVKKATASAEVIANIEADNAAYRQKVEERIDAIRESQLEKGREMNRQAMQHMQDMQRFREQRESIYADGKKRIAEAAKGVQKVQVELAQSARRGSREEYQLLAQIANKSGAEEAQRHAQAQQVREKVRDILDEMLIKLGELVMPEAV